MEKPSKLSAFVLKNLHQRMKADPKCLALISLDARIPQPWLTLYANGKIKNPGIDRVEKLYEYLTGNKISI